MQRVTNAPLAMAFASAVLVVSEASAEMIHLFARQGDTDRVMGEIATGNAVDLPSTRNTSETGVSPLFIAAKFGHAELVSALIDAGANYDIFFDSPDAPVPYGTPLHAAAAWGRLDVVRVLLSAGADKDSYHRALGTPLHLALDSGHADVARLLTDAGATTRVDTPFVVEDIREASVSLGRKVGRGCVACHAIAKEGSAYRTAAPTLWNIVGRQKASVEGYDYSAAMLNDEGAWSYEALNSFLAEPYQYLPGTMMNFCGIEDDGRRAALIAYLRTLSGAPRPLP